MIFHRFLYVYQRVSVVGKLRKNWKQYMFCMFFFPLCEKKKLWVGIEMSIVLWVSKKLPVAFCHLPMTASQLRP